LARGPNLFARLHKWAIRQDENFLTESLAVLLEVFLDREPAVGVRLVNSFTNGFISVDPSLTVRLEIRTQISTAEGRPDLELRMPDRLAVFEVKCESELRRGQLEGYREYLRSQNFPRTLLVLLSKYAPVFAEDMEHPDLIVRWYEVADALERELIGSTLADPICQFLCEQFHGFLKEQNMAIAQVSWQLSEGARALRSFLVMLQEAAKACQVTARKSMSLESIGFVLDGGKYWLGLNLEEPQKLWFGTRSRIDPAAAERLGEGIVESGVDWVPGGYRWWRAGELESEEVHFYNRSKVGQIQWLERFLAECLDTARRIETPDQPPTPPDETEE
jgi:hypothetical protein